MKRFASIVLLIVLLGAISTTVLAETYTDDANRITAEIPDEDSVYYYTPTDTNMFEDLLEQVESSGHDVRLLIRSYTSDVLGWSLEITAAPLDGDQTASPAPDPQVQDDALDAPTPQTANEGAPDYTNITVATRADQEDYEERVRAAYAGRFNFSNPTEGSLNGVPSLQMDGTGVVDSIWGSYDVSVYLVTNQYRLLTISLVYQKAEDNSYKNEAQAALSSVIFGDAPAPTPEPTPEPTPTATPTQEPTPTITPSEQPTATPAAGNFFEDLWHNIQEMFSRRPNLIYYILIGVAVVLLLVALGVHLRNVRRRKRLREEEEDEWRQINGGIAQELEAQMDKNTPSQPRRLDGTEDSEMLGEEQSQYANMDHDYTEEIFRYTQQPGPEVNDVSRFTHGYDDEVDDELKKLQDQSFVEPQPVKMQSVGSRVERNRRKKK